MRIYERMSFASTNRASLMPIPANSVSISASSAAAEAAQPSLALSGSGPVSAAKSRLVLNGQNMNERRDKVEKAGKSRLWISDAGTG